MDVKELFLDLVRYDTQSSTQTGTHPSTPGQTVFARHLAEILRNTGLENVRITKESCVFAELSATPGLEKMPALGLIAHMDTSDAASGKDVKPAVVTYQGSVLPLGSSGRVLDPEVFPSLKRQVGKTLVVTDGTTLLGADDKAGIAEIAAAASEVLEKHLPHGKLCFAFTPDEEIGEGTDFFIVRDFGADFAYTLDGGDIAGIEFQNFNAAEASLVFHGVSVHPGSAKNVMKNALKIAMEFDSMLPVHEVPAETSGYQGFYHLTDLSGTVSEAKAHYILRDHDEALFETKKKMMALCTEKINRKYGPVTAELSLRDQYHNMEKIIEKYPFLIRIAEDAVRSVGETPVRNPIRGGTDGAMLSFKGLPAPNLGTGGYNYHGEYEYLVLEEMEKSVRMILFLIGAFAGGAATAENQEKTKK